MIEKLISLRKKNQVKPQKRELNWLEYHCPSFLHRSPFGAVLL